MICAICLDNIDDGDATLTLECEHTFHASCALAWARSSSSSHSQCAMCRQEPTTSIRQGPAFSWSTISKKGTFDRFKRIVRKSVASDTEAAKTFKLLESDIHRVETRDSKVRSDYRDHLRANKTVINRHRRLHRVQWDVRCHLQSLRRQLLTLFPVTSIMLPVRAPPRAADAPRRSNRMVRGTVEEVMDAPRRSNRVVRGTVEEVMGQELHSLPA